MHHYKRNIGDYYRKAGRLNILQHGVYNLLIDTCYDREKFPTSIDEAVDWVWAETEDEIKAVEFVLKKFFTLIDGVYVQNHIQEDLENYWAYGDNDDNSEVAKEGNRERQKRFREERQQIFAQLKECGITPAFNAKMADLRALLNSVTANNNVTVTDDNADNVMSNASNVTVTTKPITNNQETNNQNTYTNTGEEKNSLDEILSLWNPDLKMVNDWLKRSGEKPFTQKQFDEFKPAFLSYYAQQLQNGLLKPDKLFGKLVTWVKSDYKSRDAPKTTKNQSKPSAPAVNRNVNDAWDALGEMEKPDPNWVDTTDYSSPDWENVI